MKTASLPGKTVTSLPGSSTIARAWLMIFGARDDQLNVIATRISPQLMPVHFAMSSKKHVLSIPNTGLDAHDPTNIALLLEHIGALWAGYRFISPYIDTRKLRAWPEKASCTSTRPLPLISQTRL